MGGGSSILLHIKREGLKIENLPHREDTQRNVQEIRLNRLNEGREQSFK